MFNLVLIANERYDSEYPKKVQAHKRQPALTKDVETLTLFHFRNSDLPLDSSVLSHPASGSHMLTAEDAESVA